MHIAIYLAEVNFPSRRVFLIFMESRDGAFRLGQTQRNADDARANEVYVQFSPSLTLSRCNGRTKRIGKCGSHAVSRPPRTILHFDRLPAL